MSRRFRDLDFYDIGFRYTLCPSLLLLPFFFIALTLIFERYLARKKTPTSVEDPHRAPGMVLLQSLRGRRFIMVEVPLH